MFPDCRYASMSSRLSSESALTPALAGERDALRPRIALVAPSLSILGGQGVQARALAEGLREEGHEVIFIPVNPEFPKGLRWLRRVPWARTVLNQLLYLPSLAALRRAHVVHVFSASYWSFLLAPVPAILTSRMFGRHVVLNYHSGEADDHLANWGRRVHPFLRLVNEIVVPSEYLKTVFARHGYRARVVRNVVDTSSFRFRERAPLKPRLLSTRNLEPHYRVDVILEAFSLIQARHPEATLTVAGYGSEEQSLKSLAARLGARDVRFVGRVEPESIPDLYDRCDIFLNASVVDNQPLSVLEAFAAGTAVVSTATGDIGHMVRDGDTGRIVPENDPAVMADAVCALLAHPDQTAAMARRARQEVRAYTWPKVRKGWTAVYAEAFI